MYKKIFVALIAITIFNSVADAKKTKRPLYENEESIPQPNVISYSTFGFNDVGSYDDFLPSSSDYTNYINPVNQESTTKLYAPAFPTALESIGYGNNNYETQPIHGQVYNLDETEEHQSSVLQYPQNMKHFLNSQSQESNHQESSGKNEGNTNYPVYGDKLNYIDKKKSNQINNTEINTFYNSGYVSSIDNKHFNLPETQTRPTNGESDFNYENVPTNFVTYSPTDIENFVKQETESKQILLNYPRVVDFTKMMQIHYPSATKNYATTTYPTILNENLYSNSYTDYNNKLPKHFSSSDDINDSERNEGLMKKNVHKLNPYDGQEFSYSYSTSHNKNITNEVKPNSEYKKKSRNKHWIQNKNQTSNFKNWREVSSLRANEYFTNTSNNIGPEPSRDPTITNFGEVVTDNSNFMDFAKYQFSDADYTNFKKMPEYPVGNNYNSIKSTKSRLNDYLNPYQHLSDATSTATSYWGNVFKANDYLPFQAPLKKPSYDNEDNDDDIVSITKRPNKYSIKRPTEIKSTGWDYVNHKPYEPSQSTKDWSNELLTRYKSEEDLLSLRNHDTSHPSYLPIHKPFHNSVSDYDYINILDKWKQSYLKAKYKNALLRDYEAIGTEVEPLHVPIPKLYPVTLPVVKPYPVHISYARPVFHHTKTAYDDSNNAEDDDYMPQPASNMKNVHYKQRAHSSHTRTRRPSRGGYQDRNRRYLPNRRRPSMLAVDNRYKRPYGEDIEAIPYKYQERDNERLKDDYSAFILYCKKRGTC